MQAHAIYCILVLTSWLFISLLISYIAVEFCKYSVEDLFGENTKDLELLKNVRLRLGAKEILRQSTEGLIFLHELGYLHRNLKPSNFRIASYRNRIFQIKLTDFRRAKYFEIVRRMENSGPPPSKGWAAPESSKKGLFLAQAVDVFILGMYYYYVLFGGVHPFEGASHLDESSRYISRIENIEKKEHKMYGDWDTDEDKIKELEKNYKVWWTESWSSILDGKAIDLIKQMVKHSSEERIKSTKIVDHSFFQAENQYQIYGDEKKPGLVHIFQQSKFPDKVNILISFIRNFLQSFRETAEFICLLLLQNYKVPGHVDDAATLKSTFEQLGFDVEVHKNRTASQIESTVANLAKDDQLDNYNSLIICILSHGSSGVILGSDGDRVSLYELQYAFNSHNCHFLHNKPKIFIIQACRSHDQAMLLESISRYNKGTRYQRTTINSLVNKTYLNGFTRLIWHRKPTFTYLTSTRLLQSALY